MSKKRYSLRNLYEDVDVRHTVWTVLTEDFDDSFERLIKEAKELESNLVKNFEDNRVKIKEMFIEYGYKMVTLLDLKKILDQLPRYYELDWTELSECHE